MRSRPRRSSISPGCAGGSSPGSPETAAPFPGASRSGCPTKSLSQKSCCRGLPRPGLRRAYPGFVDRYPSWASLEQAPLEDLENVLRPLGLWRQKALAFRHLARSIEGRGGVVPRTRTELERLPGIGPYTASAVLAIVYGRAEPLLDVNMARLLGRFLGPLERTEASPRRTLYALALRLVSSKRSLEVNWAVLDFGARVCKARRPLCQECPLRTRCAYARSRQLQATPTSNVLSG